MRRWRKVLILALAFSMLAGSWRWVSQRELDPRFVGRWVNRPEVNVGNVPTSVFILNSDGSGRIESENAAAGHVPIHWQANGDRFCWTLDAEFSKSVRRRLEKFFARVANAEYLDPGDQTVLAIEENRIDLETLDPPHWRSSLERQQTNG